MSPFGRTIHPVISLIFLPFFVKVISISPLCGQFFFLLFCAGGAIIQIMEATILQFFQSIRCGFLDVFFGVFSVLGEAMIVGGVAILVFWLAPKRAGEQIIMTALTSFPINSLMKFTIARPRPFVAGVVEYREPPFLADELDLYASFPSGHTQSSGSFAFAAASSAKKLFAWILAGALILLVMLSRLYFGAHYPTDVLAGLCFGLVIALAWAGIFRYAYPYRYLILLCLAALAVFPCFLPNVAHDYIQATGLLTGAAVALAAAHFCLTEHACPFPRRLWRVPVGAAVVGAVFALTLLFPEGEAFSLLKWFLVAFTAGFPAPYLFSLLKI